MDVLASLLLGLALAQEEVIQRSDPARPQYQEAVELCRAAEELIDRDPDAATVRLTDLLDRFGQLPRLERRLRIKVFADDAGSPYAFFPYQFRGRSRLASAQAGNRSPEDRALRVEAAVRDFERSLERGAATSKPLLQSARAAWWAALRPLLGIDVPEAGRLAAAEKARGLLREFVEDGPDPTLGEAVAWVAGELAPLELKLRGLRREDAGDREAAARIASWCRSSLRVIEGLAAGKECSARLLAAGSRASEIGGYRGSFRLKISAAPWAEVTRISREGVELSLPVRETPLVVPAALEIGGYEIDLSHPKYGCRTFRIAAKELQEGKTYLVSADLESGTVTLRLVP